MKVRISVAIPTYNRPGYLRRAVKSVLGQETRSWHLRKYKYKKAMQPIIVLSQNNFESI